MFIVCFKKLTVAGLFFFLLVLAKVAFAEVSAEVDRMSAVSMTPEVVEMAPPAPPGPYTSTGLSNITAKHAPAVKPVPVEKIIDKPVSSPAVRLDSKELPMAAFSPDIPWPSDLRPFDSAAAHRMPQANKAPGYYSPKSENHRNAMNPNANLPYMNNQQPYAYGPAAGSTNYNRYQMPGSFSPRSAYPTEYPMNRAPYPSRYPPSYPN